MDPDNNAVGITFIHVKLSVTFSPIATFWTSVSFLFHQLRLVHDETHTHTGKKAGNGLRLMKEQLNVKVKT